MLRRAVCTLLGSTEQQLPRGFAASYATAHNDYSLAMKKAAEIVHPDTAKIGSSEAGMTTGAPMETFNRLARIYLPSRTASQQGIARAVENASATPLWKIEFEGMAKWQNPLMGWTSTADPLENVGRAALNFYTKEEAVKFCEKHGWKYAVEEPNVRRITRSKKWASYGDNFSTKRKGVPDLSTLPSNRAK